MIKTMKSSSAIALVLSLSALSGAWSQAHAQVATTAPVVVSGTGTRLDITTGGTPIINIAAPRADGTSYNVFSRLNVGQEGLILNNSQAIGQSQIGGTVLANQNLRVAGAVPARLILNEVVNGTRSDLNGAIEVFGTRAGVVIANPAGITCDGCGFINISRASLSTGRPTFDGSNAFTGLQVNGGSVIIQGRGLSGGDVDFFDIVTGSASINANLYARDLVVSGGAANFNYAARTASQIGALSGVVIDSSVLGGMYANRIRLIGSGAGVGINLAGVVSALNSGVSIATDGAITVRNVDAGGDIAIASRASSVRVEEYVSSGGSTIINAAGDIVIADNQAAVNEATVTETYYNNDYDYNGYYNQDYSQSSYETTYSPIALAAASIDALGSIVLQSGRDIVHNNRGSISGDNVSLIANQDILLSGGSGVYANNLTLDAVRDVSLKASTNIRSSTQYTDLGRGLFQNTYLTSTEVIGAQLDSFGSLFVRAGRDVSLEAASLSADGVIGLTAARDIAIGGIASIGTTTNSWKTSRNVTGSSVETVSNYDGSRIAASSGLFVNAAQELEITGSALQSESGLSLWATDGTAYIAGSDIAATGDLVLSGRDIVVTGSVNSSTFDETVRSVKRGFLSKRTSTSITSNQIETIFASTLSGNRVTLDSDRQIGIFDSDIAGDSAVDITAGGNITISSIPTSSDYFSSTKVKKSGFSIGSGGLFLGVSKTSNVVDTNLVSNIGSLIGAASGAVRISAGAGIGGTASAGDLDIVGSRIAALNAITLGGDTVDIVNNVNVNTTATTYSTSSFGYTYGIQAPLINSVASLARLGDIATKTSNSRTLAVSALAAGLAIKNGYDAAKTAIDAIKSGNGAIGITLSASIGYSRSTSTSLSIDQTIVASQVTGGDVSILARAGANRTGISIYGSDIAASRDVRLFSNGAIDLGAAIETDRYSGQSSSFGISLGVSAGVGFGKDFGGKGLGISPPTITLSLSSSSSRYNGVDVTARSTIVGAGGTASVNTLGLLTIDGSQLSANRVEIDAGALNIVSRQNTSNYLSRERSLGLSLSYTLGGSFGGSLNYGGGNQYGNFASVADQAGVRAGLGGFDIRVAGLTDLKGGVIASSAAAGLNSLRTGTLRTSNINNLESYNVSNFSFGGGFGGLFLGGTGQVSPTGGTALPSFNFGFGDFSFTLPTYLTAYGSQSTTTFSAVSPASVVITSGEALSLSALAGLSRDTSIANSALTRQFTEARRAEITQDFEAARQLVTEVSTFFANRAAEQTRAEASAIAAGVEYEINPATGQPKLDASGKPIPRRDLITGNLIAAPNSGAQQYIDIAANARNNYGSGSAARIIGTAISGAAGGNVTGSLGSFVQAAALNALQAFATTRVKAIADSFFKRNSAGVLAPTTESEAVRTALQGLVGCAGAAPTGNCASGALGASSSVVLNNLITSLLQPEERDAAGNIIPRSLADQQTRTALIATLTGAIAGALGANAGVASNAGVIETENNANATTRAGVFPSSSLNGIPLSQWKLDNPVLYKARADALRSRFGNLSITAIDKIIQGFADAGKSDVAFAGGANQLDAYLAVPSNTLGTLREEKKAYVDAQVNAFVAGLKLTAEQRRQLLDDYTANRKSAADTVERAYNLSVGDVQAFVGRFGSENRTELERLDMVLGALPSTRAAGVLTAVTDILITARSDAERRDLETIIDGAQTAGLAAALAVRELRNQQNGGGFRVENINGKLVFVGKPPIGQALAGANPTFGSTNARTGFDGEVRLATELHSQTGQFVVAYGNGDGIQGVDLITVGPDGKVTLWDNKYRSNPTTIGASPAATVRSPAELDRYQAQIRNSALPENIKNKAIADLGNGIYRAVTAGDGAGSRNSTVVRYRGNSVEPSRARAPASRRIRARGQ